MTAPMRTAVLVSGSGTNLQALLDAEVNRTLFATVSLVISNKSNVLALDRAHRHGVTSVVISHRDFPTREAYDQALVQCLREHHIELVVLAGFMRIVTSVLLDAFPARVLNIHPSLLPAFPGIDAQAQALAYGVRITGCTVHFVDAGTDTGPIIAQAPVVVLDGDTLEQLRARILREEHKILVEAVNAVATGRARIEGRRVTFGP
jgi:phosphoribosylglycinamide formyltransferase 1